ncbi:MAG: hypothetical protein WBY53_05950 [Acidobacteriaceae bacterium]
MRTSAIAFTAVALFGLTTSIHATTILNENFDELTAELSVTSAGAFSTIDGTNVDIVGAGDGFASLCAAPESGNCIDMDGTGGKPQGQLESNQEFAAGTYDLSFDLVGSQRGPSSSTTVSFGNYDQTFTLASSDDTDGIIVNELVTLTSPGYLLFTSDDPTGDEEGSVLDNVVVSTVGSTSVTPEPPALLLLATGLAGLALMLHKRLS